MMQKICNNELQFLWTLERTIHEKLHRKVTQEPLRPALQLPFVCLTQQILQKTLLLDLMEFICMLLSEVYTILQD